MIIIVNCSDPSPVAGVTFSPFSDTTEGANISFNCEPGLELQREDVSVCSSGVPNPVHRTPTTRKGIILSFMVYPHCVILQHQLQ